MSSRRGGDGALQWHRTRAPTTAEVERLVVAIAARAEAWVAAQGFGPDESVDEEDDTQATLHAAAVAGHSAFEGRRASRTQRLGGREVQLPEPCAACDGYTLHAAVSIGSKERPALERLCRYVLPPPLARGGRLDAHRRPERTVRAPEREHDRASDSIRSPRC